MMARFLLVLLLASSWHSAGLASAAERPVAALCNFDDVRNSYLRDQAAENFTDVLHALLGESAPVAWVERENMEAAIKELNISAFGLMDSSAAIRIGRWVKADFAVKGKLAHPAKRPWYLLVEIIDLDRADVLAARTVTFGGPDDDAFPADAAIEVSVPAINEALAEAIGKKELAPQVIVAPLYFQNGRPANRLDFYEKDVMKRLAAANGEQADVRFVQFPRAGDAIEEAELISGGLTEQDEDSWTRVADYYVWGTYQEVDASGVEFKQVPVEATINAWDGGNKLETFSQRATAGELPALTQRIVDRLLQLRKPKRGVEIDPGVRKRIAQDLADRGFDLREWVIQDDADNYPQISPKWFATWRHAVQTLSAAAFLDPGNEIVRRELLIETVRTDLDNYLPFRRDAFWRLWHRSQAWKKYCDSFGYGFRHVHMPKLKHRKGVGDNRLFHMTALSNYVNSAADIMTATVAASKVEGRPRDIPPETLAKWHHELAQEFVRRVELAQHTDPEEFEQLSSWIYDAAIKGMEDDRLRAQIVAEVFPLLCHMPNFQPQLHAGEVREVFRRVGTPQVAEELLADATARMAAKPAPRKYPTRSFEIEPVDDSKALAPLIETVATPISLKKWMFPQQVISIGFAKGLLWTCIAGQSPKTLNQGHATLLWNPQDGSARFFAPKGIPEPIVTAMVEHQGALWLALDGHGVLRLDLASGDIRQFTERDGLPSQKMYSCCAHGNTVFVGGGVESRGVLGSYDVTTQQWTAYELPGYVGRGSTRPTAHVTELAANDDWLVAYAHQGGTSAQVLVMDRATNQWKDIGAWVLRRHHEFWQFKNHARLFCTGLAICDDRIWISTSRGLVGYDPATENFDVLSTTPYNLTGMVAAGDDLWIAGFPFSEGISPARQSAEGVCIFRYHCPSRTWLAQSRTAYHGVADCIAYQYDTLWLGMAGEGSTVVKVDLTGMEKIVAPARAAAAPKRPFTRSSNEPVAATVGPPVKADAPPPPPLKSATGAVIQIIVGAIAVIGLAGVLFFYRRRSKSSRIAEALE